MYTTEPEPPNGPCSPSHWRSTAEAKEEIGLQTQVAPPLLDAPVEMLVRPCRSSKRSESCDCDAAGERARSVSPPPGQLSGFPVRLLLGTSRNVLPPSSDRQM